MIFVSLIILIICKALINDKLSEDFYQRISAIVLLLSAMLSYNCLFLKLDLTGLSSTNFSEGFAAVYEGLNYNINYYSGVGIYTGLFHISIITQVIEIFLLITGFIILISWPVQKEIIDEFVSLSHSESNHSPAQLPGVQSRVQSSKSFLYNLVHSIYLEGGAFNKFSQSLLLKRTEGSVQDRLSSNFIVYSILNNNKFISYPINYSIIVLFSTLGALLLVSCSDLISMYLSIELQSFSLYVLSTLYKDSELSTQAGLKYFLLGALSSCLILFGIGLIYAYTGLTNFESIYSFISIYSLEINNNYVQFIYPFLSKEFSQSIFLGLIFIFVGFLFKISAAPFHNWSPDVYDDTPTIVTIWLTLIPKISILILLLELHIHIDIIDLLTVNGQINSFILNIDTITKNLLLISSLLSLIIGSVVGLAQNRIKRLLAYSTISHIGFILLALAINTVQSIDSFIFYIIQYIITNLNIFLIVIALGYIINKTNNIKDIRYISEFKGQFYHNPLIILSFSICLFSMAGVPPLIGFFSKQYVLYSAIQNGYYFIAFVAIFVSVISASYYLKIIKTFFIESDSLEQDKSNMHDSEQTLSLTQPCSADDSAADSKKFWLFSAPNPNVERLSNFHSFLISSLTLLILFFIFNSSLILSNTHLLSLSLFYQ